MTPITLERFVQELERLRKEMDAGMLQHGEYDQRLARIIGELRERKLEGDRAAVTACMDDLLKRGVITPSVREHVLKRLGIT
jgi:hypothetical protein